MAIKESIRFELDEAEMPPGEQRPEIEESPDMSSVVFYMSLGIGWHLSPVEFDRYISSLGRYDHLLWP